ncbi:hypothetical protein Ciccas_013288 [Cichlidogyrus casuarinus]|uniref:Uncharacterized protein n=1 Tax=Cichlidogyrus casuarinus TaxID=1844966 RepID=A0ABD2PM29_9PLAT
MSEEHSENMENEWMAGREQVQCLETESEYRQDSEMTIRDSEIELEEASEHRDSIDEMKQNLVTILRLLLICS